MDMQYCITHEQVVELDGKFYPLHSIPVGILDWEMCPGPFACCPPPEMTEELWEFVFANEPSADELETLSLN